MKEHIHITPEPVERHKETIFVESAPWWKSIVRTTFSLPPFRPELRVTITHSLFKNSDDEHEPDPEVYILHSNQSARLVVATLRKAADMIETYIERLPEKEA